MKTFCNMELKPGSACPYEIRNNIIRTKENAELGWALGRTEQNQVGIGAHDEVRVPPELLGVPFLVGKALSSANENRVSHN
jgi:hypothetical protein